MTFTTAYALFARRSTPLAFQLSFPKNNYAKKEANSVSMIGGALKKKKLGKLGPMVEKKVLPVEADPSKLVNFVCGSNIFKTGQDIAVKPDSEYPEWLWTLRTGPVPPLEELDPNSKEYFLRIRKLAMKQNNKLAQLRKF